MQAENIASEIMKEKTMALSLSSAGQKGAIAAIGKALSSPVRIDILNLIKVKPMSLQEIARVLGLPLSSTSMHVGCLEQAHLVSTRNQPGKRGSKRVCTCDFVSLQLDAYDTEGDARDNTLLFDMPVGSYSSFYVEPTCGLAGLDGIIDGFDNPVSFYSTQRQKAQLVWFNNGFLEYRFPNKLDPMRTLQELSFSLEVCSEAPGFDENWPSDITFSINGREIGTYTAQGDYGMRRGLLTPDVWPMGRTQYGLLVHIALRNDGGYVNKERVNPDVTLSTADLYSAPYISFEVRIKEDAKNRGGVNIFGKEYGDYPQGICMRVVY